LAIRGTPATNIEVNVYGGTVRDNLRTSGSWTHNTNVRINMYGGRVERYISVDEGNLANVSGGEVIGGIGVFGAGTATLSGGSIGWIRATSQGKVVLVGGDFRLNGAPLAGLDHAGDLLPVALNDNAVLTGVLVDGTPVALSNQGVLGDYIADGGVLELQAASIPQATPAVFQTPGGSLPRGLRAGQRLIVSDGCVVPENFNASWGSTASVTGGTVGQGFEAVGAVVAVTGGTLGEQAKAYSGSVVNVSGGYVGSNFNAANGSTVNISGGKVDQLFEALAGSTVSLSGGIVEHIFTAHPGSDVTINGRGFRINGAPVSGLDAFGAEWQLDLPAGAVLSGTFVDGRPFMFSDQVWDQFSPGTLTVKLASVQPIDTRDVIVAPNDTVPVGLHGGQALFVRDGGVVPADFHADWGSVVNIQDGEVGSGFEAVGSLVNISGGQVRSGVNAFYGTVMNISGGSFEGVVTANQGCVINISGGNVDFYLQANRGGVVNVRGGQHNYVNVNDGGTLNVSGGNLGDELRAWGGTVNQTGGAIGNHINVYQSTLRVSGGSIGDELSIYQNSQAVFIGSDFRIDGQPVSGLVDYGNSVVPDIPDGSVLSGTLADGTPFAISQSDEDWFMPGTILLVQEVNTPPHSSGGVHAGESLVLGPGKLVADQFEAGWGSTLSVNGGAVGSNFEAVGAHVTLTGGSIGDGFDAFDGSVVTMTGGKIGRDFEAHAGSVISIFGGRIGENFTAQSGSVVNVSGGTFEAYFTAEAGSEVNVFGGLEGLSIQQGSNVHLFVSEFRVDGDPLAGLEPGRTLAFQTASLDYHELSGIFVDGTAFRFSVYPSVSLTLTSVLAGDFNGDGLVNAADLATWKSSFSASRTGLNFLAWQRQLGGATTPLSRAAPEPASANMMAALAVGAALMRRKGLSQVEVDHALRRTLGRATPLMAVYFKFG
jgi:hypothetical protein